MKKTSVQNLIINALLLVEAVLIVFFLLRMITKPRDKEAGAVVPDRELTIAEQEGEIPLPHRKDSFGSGVGGGRR